MKKVMFLVLLFLVVPVSVYAQTVYAGYFPQIAVGGGWGTAVTIVNYSPESGTFGVAVYNGRPLSVDMADNYGNSCQNCSALEGITIPSLGSDNIVITTTSPNTLVGWAEATGSIEYFSGVVDYMYVPQTTLQTMVGVLIGPTEDVFLIPVHDNVPDGVMTGYAIANVTDSIITVNIAEVDQNGEVVATLTPITLGPYGHVSQFLYQDPAAFQVFQGTAAFMGVNNATFSIVGLLADQGIYSALPAIY